MKRARLATVVRIRTLQERVARSEVVRDRLVVATRERAAAAASALVEDAAAVAPSTPGALVAHRTMLGRGVRDVGRAASEVVVAEQQVADSLVEWSGAAQRLDGAERLDERAAIAEQAERDRADMAELDDLVVMRWNRVAG